MTGPVPDESMYCRTCKRSLSTFTPAGGGQLYVHAAELREQSVDHPPDPIPLAELPDAIQQCDFDSAEPALYVYACDNQFRNIDRVAARYVGAADYTRRHHAARTRREVMEKGYTQSMGEHWTACAGCAELIEADDLLGLMRRVTEALNPKLTNTRKKLVETRAKLRQDYSEFLATRRPGRGRLSYGHPLGEWDNEESG